MPSAPSIDEPSFPQRSDPAPLEPVGASERILTLDVLRGIALLGVLIANIWLWFSGALFMFPGLQEELRRPTVDSAVFLIISIFVSGKALSTFSILFGLGFAVQMMRAEMRGSRIVPVYCRRLAVLLAMGIVHAVLLWYGDILATYAMLGFALLLFRRRRERTLLVWAALLMFVLPVALGTVPLIMHVAGVDTGPPPAERLAEWTEENGTNLALFTSGSYRKIVQGNLRMLREMYGSPKALGMLMFLGLFLLGLYAGRRRIFEHPAAHRALLRRLAIWGFAIGIPATLAGIGFRLVMDIEQAVAAPWFPLAMTVTTALGAAPFALAYIATATLLLEHARWKARLRHFAPVGRMALTNYLSQTIICLAIYYGGGLLGHYRPALNLVIALLIFIVQMRVSAWWLSRYRFGPAEWLWRSLTYRHVQSMTAADAAVRSS
jgi:uncharacterized protein